MYFHELLEDQYLYSIFNFSSFCSIAYAVERVVVHAGCGLGWWGSGIETNVSVFFLFLLLCLHGRREKEEGRRELFQLLGIKGWSFDDALELLMCEQYFEGNVWVVLIILILLISLLQGWKKSFKDWKSFQDWRFFQDWLTKSTLMHAQTQALGAELGQESGPTCPAFHPLMRHTQCSLLA